MVGGRPFDAEPGLWRRVGADGHPADADEVCRLADRLMSGPGVGRTSAGPPDRRPATAKGRRPPRRRGCRASLYDEMGQLNNEVVALNRELARKNAEVERLHARVSRQAQHLTEANRHKDEFLAMLAHELRNPLAPIRNALALLGAGRPDPGRSDGPSGHDGASGPAPGPAGR